MAIPKFEAFLEPFLYALGDNKEHTAQEIKQILSTKLDLGPVLKTSYCTKRENQVI